MPTVTTQSAVRSRGLQPSERPPLGFILQLPSAAADLAETWRQCWTPAAQHQGAPCYPVFMQQCHPSDEADGWAWPSRCLQTPPHFTSDCTHSWNLSNRYNHVDERSYPASNPTSSRQKELVAERVPTAKTLHSTTSFGKLLYWLTILTPALQFKQRGVGFPASVKIPTQVTDS